MGNIKKIGIYCRISGDKKDKKDYSIDTQKQRGYKLAERNGWLYEEYIDEGKSGTLLKGELLRLISDIKNGKLHSIYAYDQSRFERNLEIWTLLQAECINNKVDIFLGNSKHNLSDPQANFFSNLLSLVNNFYSQIASQKLRVTYKTKIQQGKTHGKLPYGITRDKDNNFKILEDEANVVKLIFDLADKGFGTYKIASILNEKNIKNRVNTVWQNSTIYGILTNEIYKGIKRTVSNIDNNPESIIYELGFSIIDPRIFDRVNNKLKVEKKIKKSKYNYLLNDLLTCPYCGSIVTGRYRERDRSYKCIKFHKHLNELSCKDAFGVNLPKVDTFVLKFLFETKILNHTVIKSLKSNKALNGLLENQKDLKGILKSINKELDNLLKLLMSYDSNEAGYDTLKQAFQTKSKELADAKRRLDHIEMEIKDIKNEKHRLTIDEALTYFKTSYEFSKLQEYVHSIIENIQIFNVAEKKIYLFVIRLKAFDHDIFYISDKELFKFEMLELKDDNAKKDFESSLLEHLSDKVGKENFLDSFSVNDLYSKFKIEFTKEELIHFNDPIYKKPIEI